MTAPFTYPAIPHKRRHGPGGYADYESYRPWLRDEFAFRRAFCLTRETWGSFLSQFAIDHFVPVATKPDSAAEYANLLYSCVTCNAVKGSRAVPDPVVALLDDSIRIAPDGVMHAQTTDAARLVELLDLNDPRKVEFRSLWIAVVSLSERLAPELHLRVVGYPTDLPDLSRLRPPGGNSRPEGIAESHHARRARGELPATY